MFKEYEIQDVNKRNKLNSFLRNAPSSAFWLMCHAAVPLFFRLEWLYHLYVNFRTDIKDKTTISPNYADIADIINSPFTSQIGHKIYEFDSEIRAFLLGELEFMFEETHLKKIAAFLYQYAANLKDDNGEKNAHQTIAWLLVNPEKVANLMAESFSNANSEMERLRLYYILNKLSHGLEDDTIAILEPIHMLTNISRDVFEGEVQKKLSSYKPFLSPNKESLNAIPIYIENQELRNILNNNKNLKRYTAQERINACLENKNSRVLDLGFCNIMDLNDYPDLFKCTHIEKLILSNQHWTYNSDEKDYQNISSLKEDLENHISILPSRLAELINLKEFICGGFGDQKWDLADVSILSKFPKLETINLNNNRISDISFLKEMLQLKEIIMGENDIMDISPLANLKKLENLELHNNQISDISPIKNLRQLKELAISNNQISDISDLKLLQSLTFLDVHSNKIVDLFPLYSLLKKGINVYFEQWNRNGINIKNNPLLVPPMEVTIKGNEQILNYFEIDYIVKLIEENELVRALDIFLETANLKERKGIRLLMSGLVNLPKIALELSKHNTNLERIVLEALSILDARKKVRAQKRIEKNKEAFVLNEDGAFELDLSNSGIENIENDIPELLDCTWLKKLVLTGNKISQITGLKNFNDLTELDLSFNQIKGINVLQYLPNLEILTLTGNLIVDIAPLKNLSKLTYLALNKNKINNVAPIQNLTNLNVLYLGKNIVKDTSFLESLINLTELGFSYSHLQNIAFLRNLVNLKKLKIEDNNISDISVLDSLVFLENIKMGGNAISNIPSDFFYKHPNLKELDIRNNPIQDIPQEVLDKTNCCFELKEYFKPKFTKELSLAGQNLTTIPDYIRNYKNVEKLDLSNNQIIELPQWIGELVNLKELNLNNNQITKLEGLDKLIALQSFDISSNQIEDIQTLFPFIQREKSPLQIVWKEKHEIQEGEINIKGNPLTNPPIEIAQQGNISIIKYWNETSKDWKYQEATLILQKIQNHLTITLKEVDIEKYKGDSNTYALNEKGDIVALSLSKNNIIDISFLSDINTLIDLDLSENKIQNITPLQSLVNLTELFIYSNQIQDISPLQSHFKLAILNTENNQIQDISPLQSLAKLTTLWLSDNQIQDASPLQSLVNLTELCVFGNKIQDISPLQSLVKLTRLEIHSNKIQDISPLQSLVKLTGLDISMNQIHDISPLQSLLNLTQLKIYSNQIEDISPLQSLVKLTILNISINQIHNISPLRQLIEKGIVIKWAYWDGKEGIYLKDNPLKHPPLEIIQQGNNAILQYWKQNGLYGEEYVYEAKPTFFLLSGDYATNAANALVELNPELRAIDNRLKATQHFEVVAKQRTAYKDLLQVVKQHNAIRFFHYSGHANSENIFLQSDKLAQESLSAEQVSALLAIQKKPIKLAILNGCISEKQAADFLAIGVDFVIATTRNIGDDEGRRFADKFYENFLLATHSIVDTLHLSLIELYRTAATERFAREEALYTYMGWYDQDTYNRQCPYCLYIRKGADKNWGLQEEIAIVQKQAYSKQKSLNTIQSKIPYNLNSYPFYAPLSVIGREEELETINKQLTNSDNLLIVNGIGGIGKTNIAFEFAKRTHETYHHFLAIYGQDDMEMALLNDTLLVANLGLTDTIMPYLNDMRQNPKSEGKAQAMTILLHTLSQLPKNVLFIIDDATANNLSILKTWKNALPNVHLLVTSRSKGNDLNSYEIGTLPEPEAIRLFFSYYDIENINYNKNTITEELQATVQKIVNLACLHTLTIELLAKTAKAAKYDNLAQFRDALQEKLVYLKKARKIESNYYDAKTTEAEKKAYIHTILESAFDLAQLAGNADVLYYLTLFSVLPTTPLPAYHVEQIFTITDTNEEAYLDAIDILVENGWLQEKHSDTYYYSCHTIIQEIVREKLKPNAENCVVIIESLKRKFYTEGTDNPFDKQIWLPYGISVLYHIQANTNEIAALCNNIAIIYQAIGDMQKALSYGLKNISICEQILSPTHPSLASSYNNIANTYQAMGDMQQALSYGLKSLSISEQILSPMHPNLATSYNTIALTYQAMGDMQQALAYNLKSLAIHKQILSPTHPNLASSYNTIATTYQAMGDMQQALSYGLKSLSIREKIFSPTHPSLATSYGNIATTYEAMGDMQQALSYGLKSLSIREKICSPMHPDLATSYNNIASTYQAIGDMQKALSYGLKSLSIFEQIFSPMHPSLAASYDNIANTYQAMGDMQHALNYGLKSLSIREKIFSPMHPSLATSYGNIATTYEAMGDMQQALSYGLKSLRIREQIFSPTHPDLATSYNNIAITYYYMQKWELSLSYMKQAIMIRKQLFSFEHPDLKDSLASMSGILSAAKRKVSEGAYKEYIEWFEGL